MNAAEQATFTALANQLAATQPWDRLTERYYDGAQQVEQLGIAVPPQLRRFLTIVNWPRLTVDSLEERLDVEGFTYPGDASAADDLWAVWQGNNLDEESQLATLDSLVFGRSYVCVGTGDDPAVPLVTVESPQEMTAAVDPRTRSVTGALRLYSAEQVNPVFGQPEGSRATLYLPDVTVWLERRGGAWVDVDRDEHGLGMVPVVPLRNRPRTNRRAGSSEMTDVIPLADAAARALTNLQIAQETHAVPQRGVLGASQNDFIDPVTREPLPVWQAYFGAVWALENENAKTFEFTGSQLSNFQTVVNLYAQLVSGLTGLPPHYLGMSTDQPASADAIRSSEARLVKRAERRQRVLGGGWESVMRLVLLIRDGKLDERARGLQTNWRDPATPTVAQAADAAVKLHAEGLTSRQMTLRKMGYTDPEIELNESMLRAESLNAQGVDMSLLDGVGAGRTGA